MQKKLLINILYNYVYVFFFILIYTISQNLTDYNVARNLLHVHYIKVDVKQKIVLWKCGNREPKQKYNCRNHVMFPQSQV